MAAILASAFASNQSHVSSLSPIVDANLHSGNPERRMAQRGKNQATINFTYPPQRMPIGHRLSAISCARYDWFGKIRHSGGQPDRRRRPWRKRGKAASSFNFMWRAPTCLRKIHLRLLLASFFLHLLIYNLNSTKQVIDFYNCSSWLELLLDSNY